MRHKQLTMEQRYQISAIWKAGYLQKEIAAEIGVHKSTISRELKRNIFWRGTYKPHYAQAYAEGRHKNNRKQVKFTTKLAELVRAKLLLDWSPEQISGYGLAWRNGRPLSVLPKKYCT